MRSARCVTPQPLQEQPRSNRTPAQRWGAVNEAALDAGERAVTDTGGDLLAALRSCGYLPQVDHARINLRNCPFRLVAQDHRGLVCRLNLRLVVGAIAGSTQRNAHTELDPRPVLCGGPPHSVNRRTCAAAFTILSNHEDASNPWTMIAQSAFALSPNTDAETLVAHHAANPGCEVRRELPAREFAAPA